MDVYLIRLHITLFSRNEIPIMLALLIFGLCPHGCCRCPGARPSVTTMLTWLWLYCHINHIIWWDKTWSNQNIIFERTLFGGKQKLFLFFILVGSSPHGYNSIWFFFYQNTFCGSQSCSLHLGPSEWTHSGLLTPYGVIDLGQLWIR